MKLKKIIYIISIITLIFLIVMFSTLIYKNQRKDKITLLGNNIELSYETIDDTFTSNFMTSTLLLKMIENDASKEKDGKVVKLSNVINQSKEIIINIGQIDLCNFIKEDESLLYDEIVLIRQSEIILSNINNIFKIVNNKSNNCKITICNIDYPYTIYDEKLINIFNNINEQINQIVNTYKANLLGLSCFSFNKYNLLKNYSKLGIISFKE